MSSTSAICTACEQNPAPSNKRGWCSPCYFRWYKAGKLDTGPPPRKPRTTSCSACESEAGKFIRGWCLNCYGRWLRAGKPESGPPPKPEPAGPTLCTACGDEVKLQARGWCAPCYHRWLYEGKPEGGPAPRKSRADIRHALRANASIARDRMRKNAQARKAKALRLINESGASAAEAATALGVGISTVQRWKREAAAELKAGAQ